MGVTLYALLFGSGGGLIVLLTLLEVSKIKINPWSALAKAIGRAINGDVLKTLSEVQSTQAQTRKMLDLSLIHI